MKRLKLKCPFCGYGTRVAYITIFISSIPGAYFGLLYADKTDSIEAAYIAAFISAAITALLILTAAYLWLNRLTDEDRIKIEKAEETVWQKPNWEQKRRAAATMTVLHFEFIFIFIIFAAIVIPLALSNDFQITPLFIIVVITIFLLIAGFYVWRIIREKIWRILDDSAECTILPVSSVYVVKNSSRSRWTVENYAVIHTNEGKLILPAKTERMSRNEAKKYRPAKIEKICIVKYRGMITYFPIMQQKAVNIPKSHWDAM